MVIRAFAAAGLILTGVLATVLVVLTDASWSAYGVVGILVLAFVVGFGGYAALRLLLTKPARRPFVDRPGVDVRRTWGFGPFDPDQQPRALWGSRVWRWSRTARTGDREVK